MEAARDILRSIETSKWVEMGVLWCVAAFHFLNDNLPSVTGWLAAIYTAVRISLAVREWFAKPPT